MTIDQTRDPAIRVQGITKSVKDLHVLKGVDFDVTAGSIFALLGSNGTGKTTSAIRSRRRASARPAGR